MSIDGGSHANQRWPRSSPSEINERRDNVTARLHERERDTPSIHGAPPGQRRRKDTAVAAPPWTDADGDIVPSGRWSSASSASSSTSQHPSWLWRIISYGPPSHISRLALLTRDGRQDEQDGTHERCRGMYAKNAMGGSIDPYINVIFAPIHDDEPQIVSLVIFAWSDIFDIGIHEEDDTVHHSQRSTGH